MRRFRPVMSCICAVTVCLRCKLDTFMCSLVPVTVTLNLGEWQVWNKLVQDVNCRLY